MRFQYSFNLAFAVLLVLMYLTAGGCGGNDAKSMFAAAADSKAKRLGTMYTQFQINNAENRLLGPSDKSEFEQFIKQQNPEGLAMIGIDINDLESLFISNRDNKPFKIRWEVQGISRGPVQPVVFEEEGVDGKFIVGFTGFVEKEVDKAEYDRLWAGEADNETRFLNFRRRNSNRRIGVVQNIGNVSFETRNPWLQY